MSSNFFSSILTIFPEMFPGSLQYSLAGAALNKGLWGYEVVNIRDFGRSKHFNVDDTPYGGGNGMVMRPDVLGDAIDHTIVKNAPQKKIYFSPRGKLLTQNIVEDVVAARNVMFLCGRFEGIDQRVIEEYDIEEISIGDYVLSGGELPALILLDACIRLLPGVLSNSMTVTQESFKLQSQDGVQLLEYPLYTKPALWKNRQVPEVLLSGNHEQIQMWQEKNALADTKVRRPDLMQKAWSGKNSDGGAP